VKYNINAEFQDEAIQLADGLQLDEIESARLLFIGQEKAELWDRTPIECAIVYFHDSRRYLLDCLRLLLEQSQNQDVSDEIQGSEIRTALQSMVHHVLEIKNGPARNGSLFARKCVNAMGECEKWLQLLAERIQRTATLGETTSSTFYEIMEYQQQSLNEQHELLGAIVTHMVKGGYTSIEDFHKILDYMPTVDRWGAVAIHYVPILTAMVSQYGFNGGLAMHSEARSINTKILEGRDSKPWALQNLQAAVIACWVAEYSGWYYEQTPGSPLEGVDLEAEAQARSDAFAQSLQDGALQCILSISSQGSPNDLDNAVKAGLTRLLIGDTPALPNDPNFMSLHFRELLMEQFENFTNAFISHMPDTLRRFKTEEDDQRRKLLANLQTNIQDPAQQHDRHLERFLLIMCYAYEGRPDASETFWADKESNLYGFLQWASRRQSTPCISAFCELFRAISTGRVCALAAHNFLIEESSSTPARYRRSISLSWSQIFEELEFYATRAREQSAVALPVVSVSGKAKPFDVDEPESSVMLECYVRLMSHLCSQSADIRNSILNHPTFRVIETLFSLCSGALPGRVRACTYMTFHALLTDKATDLGYLVWSALDQWMSAPHPASPVSGVRPAKTLNSIPWVEGLNFETIPSSFEEASTFVLMLQALVASSLDSVELNDALPFPEQLGSSYRSSGIEPYVDLVLGKIFAGIVPELEDPQQIRILSANVLYFVETCLNTFNEDLIIIANASKIVMDDSIHSSSLSAYARLHPFARTMEWLFNERVLKVLFSIAHQDITEVNRALADSPLVLMLQRCIRIMILVMNLQATYLDIIKPLIKSSTTIRRHPVFNSSLTSLEDTVINSLQIVLDLGFYCGSTHEELTVASLQLLKLFAVSRKLNVSKPSKFGSQMSMNKLVAILKQDNDYEPIARSLVANMEVGRRDFELGPQAPGYLVKFHILNFLEHTLQAFPERLSIAHVMLGFDSTGDSVTIFENGLFAKRLSLFHAILRLAINYPDSDGSKMLAWSLELKIKAMQILKLIWSSSLTSGPTLEDMQEGDVLFVLWLQQKPLGPKTVFHNRTIQDPNFLLDAEPTLAVDCCLTQRRLLFEYVSVELRLSSVTETSGRTTRILSALFGSTSTEFGIEPSMTIFDVLDILELDGLNEAQAPGKVYLNELDIPAGTEIASNGSIVRYNLKLIEEMMRLQRNNLLKSGKIHDATTDASFQEEALSMLQYLHSGNNRLGIARARYAAFKAWVDLAALVLRSTELTDVQRSLFILQALQVLSPKLELYASQARSEAVLIARYAQILLFELENLKSSTFDDQRSSEVATDRLSQLFRTCIRAIPNTEVNELLREALYSVCYKYLTFNTVVSKTSRQLSNLKTVKSGGSRLVDVICDDAQGCEGTCRITAMLLLDAITNLACKEKSTYMVDMYSRSNFIDVLVESINEMSDELRNAKSEGKCQQDGNCSLILSQTNGLLQMWTCCSPTTKASCPLY
jgi:nuclear pore complex protein Nup205